MARRKERARRVKSWGRKGRMVSYSSLLLLCAAMGSRLTTCTRARGPRSQAQEDEQCQAVAHVPQELDHLARRSCTCLRFPLLRRAVLPPRPNLSSLGAAPSSQAISHPPKGKYTYTTASAPPSRHPPLQLCSVCGYRGTYGCMRCGLKYCDLGCKGIHEESRCERR